MERERNVYRLRSNKDMVLKLGQISTDELINISMNLMTQGLRIAQDVGKIEDEINNRTPQPNSDVASPLQIHSQDDLEAIPNLEASS
jgi:hypothetical protein